MKNIFKKIKDWFIRHKPSKRKVIQLYVALLYNANLKGFIKGEIFKGKSKVSCVPGLNCYSCPGAIGACPLGSIQAAISKANKSITYYVFGIILLYGLIFGRTICGWLCPVGFCQELAYKIPSPKHQKNKYTRLLSYFKYVLLIVFVIIIPLAYVDPVPGFCKYFCPAGIFEGSFFIVGADATYLPALRQVFTWKFSLFIALFVACIFIYRFFCRFICPLGAIYGLFNRFNILGVKVNKDTCIDCGLCVKECKMDIRFVGDHECINCGECIPVCPTKAIQWKGKKFILPPNEGVNNTQTTNETHVETTEPQKNNKKTKLFTQIGATLLLAGVLIYAYYGDKEKEPPVNNSSNSSIITSTIATVGQECKDFEIESINNKENYTVENGKGKFTILNFWYVNCPGCILELPYFEEFYQEHKNDVNVIAINPVDNKELATGFISEKESAGYESLGVWIDWGLTFGMANKNDNLEDYFSINNSYPKTVFIDENGIVKYMHRGGLEKEELVHYYNTYK